jgi:hypothetical protein
MPLPDRAPMARWVSANFAELPAMMKSQAKASSSPPVTAAPITAAINGLPSVGRERISTVTRWRGASAAVKAFRSSAAQNAGAAPVRSIARTSGAAFAGKRRRPVEPERKHALVLLGDQAVRHVRSSQVNRVRRLHMQFLREAMCFDVLSWAIVYHYLTVSGDAATFSSSFCRM